MCLKRGSNVRFCPPGSAILHQWQQLAQPHLGVILDARPGVVPKGYRPLELELEQVRLEGGLRFEFMLM